MDIECGHGQRGADQQTEEMKMTKTYTIPQKMSGTGSIHDLASDLADRNIVFAPDCIYAVVLAAYYGGRGYTTHRTDEAAIAASNKNKDHSHRIIDADGNEYSVNGQRLVKTGTIGND